MSPLFRRRRSETGSGSGSQRAAEHIADVERRGPEAAPQPPEPPPDPTGPLSAERLDRALDRLRKEIPASSEETPQGPPA